MIVEVFQGRAYLRAMEVEVFQGRAYLRAMIVEVFQSRVYHRAMEVGQSRASGPALPSTIITSITIDHPVKAPLLYADDMTLLFLWFTILYDFISCVINLC